jgi:acyl-CoA thioester hydrolase
MIPLQQLNQLPLYNRVTIPESYLDLMGHVNIRYYTAMFDDAAWELFAGIGMDQAYYDAGVGGAFALQHFIRYLAEIHAGETVAVRSRLLGRSAKRIHFMHFMINETTGKLAATMEVLGAHADLAIRRTSPFPPTIANRLDAQIAAQAALDWEAPVCGVIQP